MTSTEGSPQHRDRTSAVHTLRKRRQRLATIAGASVLVLILVLAGVWLFHKTTTIASHLESAMQLVPKLKSEILQDDAEGAARTVEQLKEQTSSARLAAADPIWNIAHTLPWVGANFQATTEVAISADDVAQLGAVPLVSVFRSVDWKTLISAKGIDLRPVIAAEPKLVMAAQAVRQSSDRLNGIDTDQLFPQVSRPLQEAREQLSSLRKSLDAAANAASVVPNMMGSHTPRRYLVLMQNNAESRASGGIPGALAVLSIDKGKFSLGSQSSASELGKFVPAAPIEPEQESIYSRRLGLYMQDVNLTPDFPTSASLAKSMWERKKGETVDGVISIDPVALSYLLDATGAVQLTDPQLLALAAGGLPTQLTANNVVPTLLSDVYAKIPAPAMQDAYFAGVAQKVFEALSSDVKDPKKLLDGLTRGVNERRVLVWSGEEDEQGIISEYPVGGSISGPSVSPSEFGVYFNDGTGAKMDYYVKRQVKLTQQCTADGYSRVRVQVTSTNAAPADASTSLPAYVTGGGVLGVKAGSVRTNITAYGPAQSRVESAATDGIKTPFSAQQHNDRPVGTMAVVLAPGQRTTVEMTFDKIVQHTAPTLDVTPTVQPINDVVQAPASAACWPTEQTPR